jgi:hypothetical protein
MFAVKMRLVFFISPIPATRFLIDLIYPKISGEEYNYEAIFSIPLLMLLPHVQILVLHVFPYPLQQPS